MGVYGRALAEIGVVAYPNTPDTPARFARLLAACGSPHESLSFVLVGGTSGKGSTTALLTSILRACGLRVGMLTKPHLRRFNERCQVDGAEIPDPDLVRTVGEVKEATDGWRFTDGTGPTTVERRYLTWLTWLARQRPDVVVCEVNEGGRHDVTRPLAARGCVVTNVGLDHQDSLGAGLDQIAWHKAGVARPATPLVTGATGLALDVLAAECRAIGAPLLRLGREVRVVRAECRIEGTSARVAVGDTTYDVTTPLLGPFQVTNVALAAATAHVLAGDGLPVTGDAIRRGVAAARFDGRFQVVSADPPTVVDGAHNADKAAALARAVRELYPGRPIVPVISTSAGREGVVTRALAAGAPAVFATRGSYPEPADERTIAACANACGSVGHVVVPVAAAVRDARALAARLGGVVVVTGGFRVIGDLLATAR